MTKLRDDYTRRERLAIHFANIGSETAFKAIARRFTTNEYDALVILHRQGTQLHRARNIRIPMCIFLATIIFGLSIMVMIILHIPLNVALCVAPLITFLTFLIATKFDCNECIDPPCLAHFRDGNDVIITTPSGKVNVEAIIRDPKIPYDHLDIGDRDNDIIPVEWWRWITREKIGSGDNLRLITYPIQY